MVQVLTKFSIVPKCYIADNDATAVKANDLLAHWSNDMFKDRLPRQESASLPAMSDAVLSLNGTEAVGCHCHLLELVIKDCLVPIKEDLDTIRSFVNSFKRSNLLPNFLSSFSDNKPLVLILDVTTRWSSTFRMLSQFHSYFSVFKRSMASDQLTELPSMESIRLLLTDRKYHIFDTVLHFLRPVADAIATLEGDKYPTLSLVQGYAHALHTVADTLSSWESKQASPSEKTHKTSRLRKVGFFRGRKSD